MQGPEMNPATGADGQPTAASESSASLGSATVADVERELQAALDEARGKAAEHYDQFLRAKAEADNIRRRAQEDISKANKYAVESFAQALVPVMDSLEKAVEASAGAPPALREGIEITLRQLRSAFERNALIAIDPKGEKFDPHRHQAISMVPGEGVPANHVVAVLQKGWLIADRVLRPALVTVAQS